ncbi:hypothetical protein BDZ91DRAFT_437391 [Kalaharituber pfeilii]|nr:hypothetical protein BDZ91DRAFT_437391 [Kalaharituber pfeilii]
MPARETNPFRRASLLRGNAREVPLRQEQVYPTSEAEASSEINHGIRSLAICCPVPTYSRSVPDSHIVDGDILEFTPPTYPAKSISRNSLPPNYDEIFSAADRIRGIMGLPTTDFRIDLPDYAASTGTILYENGRNIREATENRRRDLEKSKRVWERRRHATGIWACFRCFIAKPKTAGGPVRNDVVSKKFCFLALVIVVMIITIPIVLIKVVARKQVDSGNVRDKDRLSAQMLELTGFPPIPTGVSLMQPVAMPRAQTTCVKPPELWSCNLPPPISNSIPEFRFEIRYRPMDRQKDGPDSIWAPRPPKVPSAEDYQELAAKDSIQSNNTAGIKTEFLFSMTLNNNEVTSEVEDKSVKKRERLSSADEDGEHSEELLQRHFIESQLVKRQSIADPSQNPPNMLPYTFRNQPLRLMDKSLPSEHYTAHIYFQKSIYLDSIRVDSRRPLANNEVPGSSDAAKWACVWSFTRFKVQIFTRKSKDFIIVDKEKNRFRVDSEFGKSMINQRDAILPYPVTISADRVSGRENDRAQTIACYEILNNEDESGKRLGKRYSWIEWKNTNLGAEIGNSRGCVCEWSNWKEKDR